MINTKEREHIRIDVGFVNEMIEKDLTKFIRMSEERYTDQLDYATQYLVQNIDRCSVLLLSGPSASTKTTTANKLSERLAKMGVHSIVLSLDDFFINRVDLPKLPNGDTDYESIDTLDVKKLRDCLDELVKNRMSDFPIFDFTKGERSKEVRRIEIPKNTLIMMEGIHALNPAITSNHEKDGFLKLYVSPHSDFFNGDDMVLSARNLRFVRRMVRDYFYRNNPVGKTIKMWENVVKSEVVNIMPHRVNADLTIDSVIMYEPCIYSYYLESILEKTGDLTELQTKRIEDVRSALKNFVKIDIQHIPTDTVLHEFLK